MKKCCATCKETKLVEEFHTNKGKPKSYCKACAKTYRKSYYYKNREYAIQYAMKSNEKKKKVLRNHIYKYLQTHPCVDCGESDPIVLEFDHREPHLKTDNISALVFRKISLSRVEEEIAKCDVRCCNCHRRKTARDGNWIKSY